MKRVLATVAVWTLAGCRLGGAMAPIPLAGPAPRTIVVWPWPVAEALPPELQQLLRTGLDDALRRRGYTIVAAAVAEQLLADAEPGGALDGERIRLATGADAVLQLCVAEFELRDARGTAAAWDLGWRLRATADQTELWRFDHHGRWQRREVPGVHPHPRDEFDRTPVLFGDGAPDFRDVRDLVPWLHRFALEHLPRAGG